MKIYELSEHGNIATNICCASWPLVQESPLLNNNTNLLPPSLTVTKSCHALPNSILTFAACYISPHQDQVIEDERHSEWHKLVYQVERGGHKIIAKNASTKLILEPFLLLTHAKLYTQLCAFLQLQSGQLPD